MTNLGPGYYNTIYETKKEPAFTYNKNIYLRFTTIEKNSTYIKNTESPGYLFM